MTQLSPDTFKAKLMVIDRESGIKSVSIFKLFFFDYTSLAEEIYFRVLELVMLKHELIKISWCLGRRL